MRRPGTHTTEVEGRTILVNFSVNFLRRILSQFSQDNLAAFVFILMDINNLVSHEALKDSAKFLSFLLLLYRHCQCIALVQKVLYCVYSENSK